MKVYIIAILLNLDLLSWPSLVDCRKHRLELTNDGRNIIQISTFGFLKEGYLEVQLNKLFIESNSSGRDLIGFTMDKKLSSRHSTYSQDIDSSQCTLSDTSTKDLGLPRTRLIFVFDFKDKWVKVNCSKGMEKLQIYRNTLELPFSLPVLRSNRMPVIDGTLAQRNRRNVVKLKDMADDKLKLPKPNCNHEGAPFHDSKNFRPITVCSVLRRVVEKVLDTKMRFYVPFCDQQRGFTNKHGTLINTSLLHASLIKAKNEKLDYTNTLFDVTQAFDKIGHKHAMNRIQARRAPTSLKNLTMNFMINNYTRINTIKGKSQKIYFKCGVMQGAPQSPWIYNNAEVDEILELNEPSVKNMYGFQLHPDFPNETLQNFADDSDISANSRTSAIILNQTFIGLYDELGLQINPKKSQCISLVKGELCTQDLILNDETKIKCIGANEMVKYLGVNFNDEITSNEEKLIQKFHHQIERLVATTFLNPDQKLNIINEFIWPILIFPLQHIPLHKLSPSFFEKVDKILKSSVKEILQIPTSTPDAMIYSSRKVKGLGIIKTSWEANIQNYNASDNLQHCGIEVLNAIRNFEQEKNDCLSQLNLSEDFKLFLANHDQELEQNVELNDSLSVTSSQTSKKKKLKKCKLIRNELQRLEYEKWCKLPSKGQGVIQFSQCPAANKWITRKFGLSTSEWINAIKMNGNVLPNKSNPGYSQGNSRCRYCNEFETLGHILGKCPRGELLRNNRHHSIRSLIAAKLKENGFIVQEEVYCEDNNGTSRRVDILAIEQNSRKGYILDPTIRMEQDIHQPENVNQEKKFIYDPCIPYFQRNFNLKEMETIGLYIGARGTVSNFFVSFLKRFRMPMITIEEIVSLVLKNSALICRNHLYKN